MEMIQISFPNLTDVGIFFPGELFVGSYEKLPKLTRLSIELDGVTNITLVAKKCQNLEVLHLSAGHSDLPQLKMTGPVKFDNLTVFVLSGIIGVELFTKKHFSSFPRLKELVLHSAMTDDDVCVSLAESLPPTVKFLTIKSISIFSAKMILSHLNLTVLRVMSIFDDIFVQFETKFRFPRENPEFLLVLHSTSHYGLINGVQTSVITKNFVFTRPMLTRDSSSPSSWGRRGLMLFDYVSEEAS